MINRYKRYCSRCYYTMYSGESSIQYKGAVAHEDCVEALSDKSITRNLNPRIEQLIGKVSKKKLLKILEEYKNE